MTHSPKVVEGTLKELLPFKYNFTQFVHHVCQKMQVSDIELKLIKSTNIHYGVIFLICMPN